MISSADTCKSRRLSPRLATAATTSSSEAAPRVASRRAMMRARNDLKPGLAERLAAHFFLSYQGRHERACHQHIQTKGFATIARGAGTPRTWGPSARHSSAWSGSTISSVYSPT